MQASTFNNVFICWCGFTIQGRILKHVESVTKGSRELLEDFMVDIECTVGDISMFKLHVSVYMLSTRYLVPGKNNYMIVWMTEFITS